MSSRRLGLAALGAAGGYYYFNTTQDVKTKPVEKEAKSLDKKPIDYEEVYNAIADILEDNE